MFNIEYRMSLMSRIWQIITSFQAVAYRNFRNEQLVMGAPGTAHQWASTSSGIPQNPQPVTPEFSFAH